MDKSPFTLFSFQHTRYRLNPLPLILDRYHIKFREKADSAATYLPPSLAVEPDLPPDILADTRTLTAKRERDLAVAAVAEPKGQL